ncbi:MAG: hypothetical protein NC253_01115 [Ruminococcus sp.]|nr:hypothetical protein [Ruminococcus sp.]MCM1382764.1 hypothetical protein [Muribaculaceae bacterium]
MSKQIDKLMRISDLGYVDRFEDIEEILKNFLNYTVEDILYVAPPSYQTQVSANNIVQFLGNIEHKHENVSYTNSLTISDLICTMRYFLDNSANSHTTLLSYMKNFRNNIYSLNLPWAELFFAIRLDRLIAYFDNKFNTNSFSIFYKTICYMTKRYTLYEINAFTTVGTLFNETFAYMFADWTPGYDIDFYTESINACCSIFKLFFVNILAAFNYNNFNINKLAEKVGGKVRAFDKTEIFNSGFAEINF